MTDPTEVFETWYAEARGEPAIPDASAMALATADRAGRPSVRMVLLKAHDERGFVFFTNLNSPKATALRENPYAEICFHWAPLKKQVRISGRVEQVADSEGDAYFATRPRTSQLGAWASKQSEPMPHRYSLQAAVAGAALRFPAGKIDRPENWSGFRLVPSSFEFWMDRPFRLHDRVRYALNGGQWQREWLYP
jgi:pyridoxamine 5'-phosphate oxidase